MLTLAATRVDERGHFRYVVEGAVGNRSVTTDDLSTVVGTLVGVGIQNPYQFVAHAEQWGWVEIVGERSSRRNQN